MRAGALLLPRLSTAVLPLVAGMLLARAADLDELGAFMFAVALITGGQYVVEFGLDKLLPREFALASDARDAFARWTGLKLAFAALLALAALAVTWALLPAALGPVAALAVTLFTYAVASTARSWLIARDAHAAIARAAIAGAAVAAGALLAAWIAGGSAPTFAVALAGGALVDAVLLARGVGGVRARWRRRELLASLAAARPFAVQALLAVLYTRAAPLALGAAYGAAAVARFSMPAAIYTALGMLPAAASLAQSADLARAAADGDRGRFVALLRAQLARTLAIVAAAALAIALTDGVALALLYGTVDPTSEAALAPLLLAAVVSTLNAPIAIAFAALDRADLLVRLSLATAAAGISLTAGLALVAGPVGAAIGILLTDLIVVALCWSTLLRTPVRARAAEARA